MRVLSTLLSTKRLRVARRYALRALRRHLDYTRRWPYRTPTLAEVLARRPPMLLTALRSGRVTRH